MEIMPIFCPTAFGKRQLSPWSSEQDQAGENERFTSDLTSQVTSFERQYCLGRKLPFQFLVSDFISILCDSPYDKGMDKDQSARRARPESLIVWKKN